MQTESKINILLVDDQPENLLALEAILEKLGENLVRANSGEEALRSLLHQDFAVILLDVQMPGMDGFETATLIRSRGRSRETPIIFLTAFSTSDQMQFKGYALGAVDYLLKPLDANILTSKVTVFVELFKKTEAIKRQAAQLEAINSELRYSEERFRSLSTCSPVGIFETDTQGNCTYTNPRYQAICGVSSVESIRSNWLVCVISEDKEQAIASWSAYIKNGKEYSQEFRFHQEDDIRWLQLRSSPMVSLSGELLGHVGTIEDITERKSAEEAKIQMIREVTARQEAEAANRMKDEFLAVLSHELRTPLTSILGWSKILRSRKLDEKATSRALDAIERNATSQAQLIEDILDVSRVIRGQMKLNICAVNLASVVEAAIEALHPLAESKEIKLNTLINTNVGGVCGDPNRLQQIVYNLLNNAIKFTPKGGSIEIRLSEEQQETQDYAKIQVTDTGIGISSDFLPKVFERFRQADSTTTRSHNGLGLGLAIVRHLVELHKGTVLAESAGEGKGATFTVKIPLIQRIGTRVAESSIDAANSDLADAKILMVHDETNTY
jgi:hypothetical protein